MGALGGLITFDGGPAERPWVEALARLLARRGPDSEQIQIAGRVGLIYRAFGRSPLDVVQSGLWESADGAILVFEGRLDNAPDLADQLGLSGDDIRSDSAILLAGFRRHGSAFAGSIIGDFALAYWDPRRHELTLSRDHVGARTLYYCKTEQMLAFATDLGSLVKVTRVDRDLDEDYIVGYLTGCPDEERTVYRHVRSVRPAHVLTTALDGHVTERVVWELPVAPTEIAYSSDREYEEQCRHLFEASVRARLRTSRPVAAELSGGLDSSSVVCVADHLIRSRSAIAPSLITLTNVLDESPTSDEEPFRAAVETHCNCDPHHIRESVTPGVALAEHRAVLHVPSNYMVIAGTETALGNVMQDVGAHVLLSGQGGDEVFCSTNWPTPGLRDLWIRGRIRDLHRELRMWSESIQRPYVSLMLEAVGFGWGGRHLPWRRKKMPRWIHARLHERLVAMFDRRDREMRCYRLPSQRLAAAGFLNNLRSISMGCRQDFAPTHLSFPYLDRRLLEFLCAVPFSQKLRCGESRSLQRRALQELLPVKILNRRGKGIPSEAFIRRLRRAVGLWESLLTGSLAHERCFIDANESKRCLRRYAGGVTDGALPLPALGLEVWLRTHTTDTGDAHATQAAIASAAL